DSDDNSNNSLSLRSTSNSSSSKCQTKRHIELYFQGGEGVVTYINGAPEVRCSAGFSAVHSLTLEKYLFTSARCLSSNTQEIYHAVWDSPNIHQNPFGVLREFKLTGTDYALIEKLNNEYKLNPFIRNSLWNELPSLFIDSFNFQGVQLPANHHLCISGYDSHVKCGSVTNPIGVFSPISLRPGSHADHFSHMIRAIIDGDLSDRDRGGTVFSMEPGGGNPFLMVHGILTDVRYVAAHDNSIVTIQPLYRIIQQNLNFSSFRFVDLDIYQQFQQ
ncbi:15190_t:CDS:1, partial [Gigaspora margarita]